MAVRVWRPVTPDEYLQKERASRTKNEYHDGVVVAMAGASWEHNVITANIARALGNQLEGSPCVVVTSDLRVRVPECNRFFYPDVVVVCGEPRFEDAEMDTLMNPTLLIEVLSNSTERLDREEKSDCYRTVSSLHVCVLAAQDKPRLELYIRQPDGAWRYEVAKGQDAEFALPSIGANLRLSDAYARISFPPEAAPDAGTAE